MPVELYGAGILLERAAEGVKKGVGLRDDIEGQFVVLEIPRDAGGPGGKLVVPPAADTLEIVIAQPLNARRQVLGLLDGITRFVNLL
jgi:hypothetical protein